MNVNVKALIMPVPEGLLTHFKTTHMTDLPVASAKLFAREQYYLEYNGRYASSTLRLSLYKFVYQSDFWLDPK